jgi:hypothetical protein
MRHALSISTCADRRLGIRRDRLRANREAADRLHRQLPNGRIDLFLQCGGRERVVQARPG